MRLSTGAASALGILVEERLERVERATALVLLHLAAGGEESERREAAILEIKVVGSAC
jgi:hypothetical protein